MEKIIILTESELQDAIIKAMKFYFKQQLPIKHNEDVLNITLEDCEFTVRTFNCLKIAKINTLGDLIKQPESSLRQCRNFGDMSLKEVKRILQLYDLKLYDGSDKNN